MSNWKTYKLGELLEIKYGKDHKHLADGNIPLYGSGGIMRYVDTPLYEQESILIPRKGTLSNLFYLNIPFWSVDTMFYTKIKEGNNGKYLYYLLKSMDLASMNVGSAVPSLTTEVLNKVEIKIPDLASQVEIAQILSSLDDKIELLQQMNQTLENIAQAIFKEWFVNFNFPGFDGESLDGLPKGWRMNTIGELVYVQNGFAFKSGDFLNEGKEGVLKIKNISNNVVDIVNMQFIAEDVANKIDKRFKVESGDLLIAMTGAEVGKIGIVPKTEKKLWLNQRVGLFKEKKKFTKWFCYLILSSSEYQNMLLSSASGSAQPNISAFQIEKTEILVPRQDVIEKFGEIINPIFEKILENHYQIQTLTQTRNTLLPKLMSGQLEIKN